MARSSSARKISRLAAKGKGRTVRVRGGSVFPTTVLTVCLVGVVLVAYARQTAVPVDVTDVAPGRYATAFGVYYCDEFVPLPIGPTDPAELDADATIRVDAEGVLTWKPQVLAGERRARLGTIFETLGMTVSDDSLTLPSISGVDAPITESSTTCGDQPATLSVSVWDDPIASAQAKVSIASLSGVRLTGDGMAITLAFTAAGTEVPQPPATDDLSLFQSRE